MKIEWTISPENLARTTRSIGAQKDGHLISHSEICWARLILCADQEHFHDFGEIAALEFFTDLISALGPMKSLNSARRRISDIYQSYDFTLEKVGAELDLGWSTQTKSKTLRFDFESARNKSRYLAGLFLSDYLQLCPTLRDYQHIDSLCRTFNARK